MEKLLDKISFRYSDPEITGFLNAPEPSDIDFTLNFNQNEDSFLKSEREFTVPSFAVHHDVSIEKPSEEYLSSMRRLIRELTAIYPSVFRGTKYYFDPSEILNPCFIQFFKAQDAFYLYLFRLDLNIRLADCRILTQATNDRTAEYSSSKLFFESLLIPAERSEQNGSALNIPVKRLFSSTWIGETGTGYHLNGQWIDREVTKFLSRLFLPENLRNYPYYPLCCDFNTVCCAPSDLSPEGRKFFLTYFHRLLPFIDPEISDIENEFKSEKFDKQNPLYLELKKKVPDEWTKVWSSLKISAYLNENEMKEYLLEFQLP